jgi:HK97 gp10 family phage protein
MKHFDSLGDMAAHLLAASTAEALALQQGLRAAAVEVEKTAKGEIGTYQKAVGPFPEWAPLADSTEDRKARMGYPADSPLLATGEMQESITHEVEGLVAVVGTPDQKALYHELGTARMPPRPVLGPALMHNQERIEKLIGEAAVAGILGGAITDPTLGYGKP